MHPPKPGCKDHAFEFHTNPLDGRLLRACAFCNLSYVLAENAATRSGWKELKNVTDDDAYTELTGSVEVTLDPAEPKDDKQGITPVFKGTEVEVSDVEGE